MGCSTEKIIEGVPFREAVQDNKLADVQSIYESCDNKIKLLLERDSQNRLALHISAYYGYPEVTEFLVQKMKEHNLNIDAVSKDGQTPLFLACLKGYKEKNNQQYREPTMRALLKGGANAKAANTVTKMTCLHWACYHAEDTSSVKALLEYQADPLTFDFQDFAPIDITGIRGTGYNQMGALDLLLHRTDEIILQAETANESETVLDLGKQTTIKKKKKKKKKLIDKYVVKSQLSSYTDDERALLKFLYWASVRNKEKVVMKIIKRGISPFVSHYRDYTALRGAIRGGALDCVKLFHELSFEAYDMHKKYNVKEEGFNEQDSERNSCLHLAAIYNQTEIYNFLDKITENRNKRNLKGFLPAELNHTRIVDPSEAELEYDIVVQASKDPKNGVEEQLKRLNLYTEVYRGAEEDVNHVAFAVPTEVYSETAERLKFKMEVKRYGFLAEYSRDFSKEFVDFSTRQKQTMISTLLSEEIDLLDYKKYGIVLDHFPLHTEKLNDVKEAWDSNCCVLS